MHCLLHASVGLPCLGLWGLALWGPCELLLLRDSCPSAPHPSPRACYRQSLGSRLQIRGIGSAFTAWVRVYRSHLHLSHEQRLVVAEGERRQLEAEVERLQARVAEVSSQRDELTRKLIPLAAGSDDVDGLLAAQAAADRQLRIETFGRQIVRRILHDGVRRGFTTWHAQCASHAHAKQTLERTARRLRTAMLRLGWETWCARHEALLEGGQVHELRQHVERLEAKLAAAEERAMELQADLAAKSVMMEQEKAAALDKQRVALAVSHRLALMAATVPPDGA